jgi:hypothetical protein
MVRTAKASTNIHVAGLLLELLEPPSKRASRVDHSCLAPQHRQAELIVRSGRFRSLSISIWMPVEAAGGSRFRDSRQAPFCSR